MKRDGELDNPPASSEAPLDTRLIEANGQLVVNALRIETRFRAYFDISPECLYLLRLTADDQLILRM